MVQPLKDKGMWKTGVACHCSAILYAYLGSVFKGKGHYQYYCKSCNMRGPWVSLAKRHVK